MKRLAIWSLAAALLAAPAALAEPGGTIVAFGDSITKGLPHPWPEDLEARLHERFPNAGFTVINAGIPGNRLLSGIALNPDGLSRFGRDALDRSGVKTIILLEGINDIGQSDIDHAAGAGIPDIAPSIIAADRILIAEAHAHHVKIFGGTLTPFTGIAYPGYFSPAGEAQRQAVNRWIRGGDSGFDAIIDFDAALRDPDDPTRLRPQYDSGDHLHPSASGEAAMAAAIDLALFQ
jgi:lysophospholipase L1-like esterase